MILCFGHGCSSSRVLLELGTQTILCSETAWSGNRMLLERERFRCASRRDKLSHSPRDANNSKDKLGTESRPHSESSTWTPKVCRRIAFLAVLAGLGPLFYKLLGFG